jgi:hypothetical protein
MYSDDNFKKKYLKYKQKYLELKDSYLNIEMKGGDKPFLTNDNINLFNPAIQSQELMESYLNPVYGLYMCESGFITNNFYLSDQSTELEYAYANKIRKLSRDINGSIQPTLEFENVNPIDIGRYIALLYICKNNKNFINMNTSRNILTIGLTFNPKDKANQSKLDDYIKTLRSYIDNGSLIKTAFPITDKDCKNMTDIDFHIILYCLWWVSKNNEGILNYYKGINEVINICNEILSWGKHTVKYEPIDLGYTNPDSDGFEKLALDITKKSFHKYEMQYPQHFCPPGKGNTYPDCGEITARNLINLICFDHEIKEFNIEILRKYEAIPELVEYYQVFNTFKKQSAEETAKIYEQDLAAKDAWSRLIIYHANNNLRFNKSCNNGLNYELLDGMAADGTTTNFFQLIKNLLPAIKKWENLNTEPKRFEIVSNDTDGNGFGKIVIETRDYSTIRIECMSGHYNMDITKKIIDYDTSKLKESHKFKIDILLNKEIVMHDIQNFLWINWNSELLVKKINDLSTDIKLRRKLLELSFTEKIKSDTRRQINIDTQEEDGFFTYFVDTFETNNKINEYTYKSNDFEFVRRLPKLTHLKCIINSESTEITLDPLSNILTIGDGFLNSCSSLTNIDLTPLSKVTSIGNNFLYSCYKLKEINFPSVSNVTSIGYNFLDSCSSLTNIDLTPLSKVTSIGNNFLYRCVKLENIDLSPLSKVTSIGSNFLYSCSSLTNIDLTPLSKVTSIGYNFLSGCVKLENIDLSLLSNVTTIGNKFLSECSALKNIDLSPLSKVTSIGYKFLSECSALTNIDLTPLSNVTSIGTYFLSDCKELKNIDLSPLSNVTSIGNTFLYNCSALIEINLEPLSKVTSIGNKFLSECSALTNIDLSPLSNVTSIGDSFLSDCKELKNIDLSPLSNVTSIGDTFLYNCSALIEINLEPLSKVTSIGNDFLSICYNLENIDFPSVSKVTSIGDRFLSNCTQLTNIDLTSLSNVTSIGNKFMSNCSALIEINLEPLSKVTSIGDGFLTRCVNLENIDLTPLSKVRSIGNNFMSDCINLKNINLSTQLQLTSVGSYFLENCSSLEYINNKVISKDKLLETYIFKIVKST